MLVFFGSEGWGRLVNISEDGMAFEVSGLPDTNQVISLELVDLSENRIQVDGRIVWARHSTKSQACNSGRSTESKQQIRQWIATGKATQAPAQDEPQPQAKEIKPIETLPSLEEARPNAPAPPRLFLARPAPVAAPPKPVAPPPAPVPAPPPLAAPPPRSAAPPAPIVAASPLKDAAQLQFRSKKSASLRNWPNQLPNCHPGRSPPKIHNCWRGTRITTALTSAWISDPSLVGHRRPLCGLALFALASLFTGLRAARYRQSRARRAGKFPKRTSRWRRLSQTGQDAANAPAGPFEV